MNVRLDDGRSEFDFVPTPATECRRALKKAGFDPIPVNGKKPDGINGWTQKIGTSDEEIVGWQASYPSHTNTGIVTRRCPTFDIDVSDEAAAESVESLIKKRFEERGRIIVRIGRAPKRAIPFRTNAPFKKIACELIDPGGKCHKLEFLGDGQQFVADGIHPDTKQPYRWHGGDPLSIRHDELPDIGAAEAHELFDACVELLEREHNYKLAIPKADASEHTPNPDKLGDIRHVRAALRVIPNNGGWNWFNLFGMATFVATNGSDEGLNAYDAWAQKSPLYAKNPKETPQTRWESYRRSRPTEVGMGTLVYHADKTGLAWLPMFEVSASPLHSVENDEPRKPKAQPKPDERAPAFSDEALALGFAISSDGELHYVPAWNRWLSWDGQRWLVDERLAAFDRVRKHCRKQAVECNKARTGVGIASAKTIAAVERLARADRRLVAVVQDWDADPWALNTPAGIVDLRTGKIHAHHPGAMLTKITGVAPDRNCPTPVWRAFLKRVTQDDAELEAFLKRFAGYCLTGSTREHALMFLYGLGANGKSTFVNALTKCLGDYHITTAIETFTASDIDRHPTELAILRGARLVTATETEEGRRWAESRIKQLTGGERVSARFMRQDPFEYEPQFKLIIAGNHRPGLRSVDEAIRRRLNLVPFTATIPPSERDPELPDKLRAELPGILAWMIEGCLEWQREGLAAPQAVTAATSEYMEAEDTVGIWIDENCYRDPHARMTSAKLYADHINWAQASGERIISKKQFGQRLQARGFAPWRDKTGRGFFGLALNV
jgi:putative DNA primase/helicase